MSRNVKAVFLKLEMYITKEWKWNPSCRYHDNSYATGPVLIKIKISRSYLKQGSSTPNNLMEREENMGTMCIRSKGQVPSCLELAILASKSSRRAWNKSLRPVLSCKLFRRLVAWTSLLVCADLKGCKSGYLVFHRRRLGPKCHSVSFVVYISGSKFEEHRSNISSDILDSVELFMTSSLYLHNTKTCISLKRKEIFRNRKRHFSLIRKAFQISSNNHLIT